MSVKPTLRPWGAYAWRSASNVLMYQLVYKPMVDISPIYGWWINATASQVWNTAWSQPSADRGNQLRPENHMHHETWPRGVRHGAKGLGSHPRCHRSRRPRSNWAYHTWSPGWSVHFDRLMWACMMAYDGFYWLMLLGFVRDYNKPFSGGRDTHIPIHMCVGWMGVSSWLNRIPKNLGRIITG